MNPSEPVPVKLICGVLFSDENLLQDASEMLRLKYGPIDYTSPAFPFDVTDYYDAEMGHPIQRLFYSFLKLVTPGCLAHVKIECNEIENQLAINGNRKINLDPGYMDYDKFVLASAKYNAHKIYLSEGIYADLTLRYEKGHYVPSPYCFPDFKTGIYNDAFLHIRAKYKGQLRKILAKER
jgi:hypothetical protein